MKKFDPSRPIKVAIADDHALFRQGVRTALSVRKDIEMIAEADNGMQLLNLLKHIDHSMISKLMEVGANSYLTKNSDSETIYQAIKTCFEQEFFFNELTNKALLTGLRTKKIETNAPDDV